MLGEISIIGRIYLLGDEIRDNERGSPFPQYQKSTWHTFLIWAHLIGVYWLLIFLNNFNDYVTTAVTLNNFFENPDTKEISNIRIFCHVLSHNIGTIAWSIVLLPALILKLVFGIFDYMLSGK